MHVVGHLHIGVQLAASCLERVAQPFAIGEIILLREKTGVAIVAALNEVQGQIEKAEALPSQRGPRNWRTRADPLAGVWTTELVPLLEAEPGLQGRTLFEELQRRHGERFGTGVLRTLQRRVRAWAKRGQARLIAAP